MDYDEEDFDDVGSNKVRRFLSDNKVRTKAVRKFYQDKGIFLLSDRRSNIADELPFFILNFTSIDELQAYSGKKVYGSLSGVSLRSEVDTNTDEVYNGLVTNQTKNNKDGIKLTDIRKSNDSIEALLRYENMQGGVRLLGKSQTARRILLNPARKDGDFLINCEVHSLSDYSTTLKYFRSCDAGIKSYIVEMDVSTIKDTKLRHALIINSLKEVEMIKVKIKGTTTSFRFLGVYSHNVVKADDLKDLIAETTEYGKKLQDSSNNINLTALEDLLPLLENELKSYTSVFDGLYWSEKESKYLLVTFVFNKSLILIYNSTRTYEKDDLFNGDEFEHPARRRDFNDLVKVVLPEEEIRVVLNTIWTGCANYLSESLDAVSLGKLKVKISS